MKYKNKSLILSLIIIIIIQILLFNSNSKKSNFKYFIWDIQSVSVGKLLCISFISGFIISSIINKTIIYDKKGNNKNEEADISETNNYTKLEEDNIDSFDMPPERDVRDVQPTISVNYRVIKNNGESVLKERNQTSSDSRIKDDWNDNYSQW